MGRFFPKKELTFLTGFNVNIRSGTQFCSILTSFDKSAFLNRLRGFDVRKR